MKSGVVVKKITPSAKQQECIESLDGSVMVLAGPGTGKTFTVIQRLKYMLSKGTTPESILCLTFSETAASEMKSRLISEVGDVAQELSVSTYHAFCNELISKFPEQFQLLEGVDVVDDVSRYCLMRETFEQFLPEFLKTDKGDFYFYIKPVVSAISEIKKSRTTKEQYYENLESSYGWGKDLDELLEKKRQKDEKGDTRTKTLIKDIESKKKAIAKADEVWKIFDIYQVKLKEKNYIDYDDMINFVLDMFESDEDFLKKVAAQFKYFLVDEYQDTNFSQNQLVFKLAEGAGSNNVFVVGDDDQIIYGFQGAQSDNLEKFLTHYPNTKVICLDENRRSTQNILDFSYQVMTQDDKRLENNLEFLKFNISKKLTSKNEKLAPKNSPIKLFNFDSLEQEKVFIVNEIQNIIKNGQEELSEIAVLVNKNSEAKEISELLKGCKIPFQLKSNKSIFDVEASICFIFYLKALLNSEFYADKLFGLLLCEPFAFMPNDYCFLLEKAREKKKQERKDFVFLIQENLEYSWQNKEKVHSFINTYEKLKEEVFSKGLVDILQNILDETGILEFYENTNAENIAAIERILDEAKNLQSANSAINLVEFLAHLDVAYEQDLVILIEGETEVQNAVQLMTLHGSKGREFEYVFMCDLTARKWEKKRNPNALKVPVSKNSFDDASEQLRLLFVGITRTKHSLYLTHSNSLGDKPQELTKHLNLISKDNKFLDSRYLEVAENYFEEAEKSSVELKFDYRKDFSDKLKTDVKDIELFVSSLNKYIDCPRAFLYSYIYKIPTHDADKKALNYGDAIHKVLEDAVSDAIRTGNYPLVDEVIENFKARFCAVEIKNEFQKQAFLERGEKALSAYYPFVANFPIDRLKGVEYSDLKATIDGVRIKGQIDRIEINDDGTFSLYDYKTGSSKTGAGKRIDEEKHEKYLNQLRFYKLLFELKGYSVSQAGLIYVEDFEKNYTIETTPEDIEIIKNKIFEVYQKIQNLEFNPVCEKQCGKPCEYCNYKMLCKLNVI